MSNPRGVWVFPKRGKSALANAVLLDRAEHRDLCEAFEACIRAGEAPGAAWRLACGALRRMPTWMLQVLAAVEARRLRVGWSGETLARVAGISERSYHKLLRPWGVTDRPGARFIQHAGCGGRIATPATLRFLVDAIETDGRGPLKVKDFAMTRAAYERKLTNLLIRHQRGRGVLLDSRGHARKRMRALSPLGVAARIATQNPDVLRLYGMRGGWAAAEAMTPEQRRARAKKAAKVRWDRVRAEGARWAQADGGLSAR